MESQVLDRHYSNRDVYKRIIEFLGGESLSLATAVYLVGSGETPVADSKPQPISALPHFLHEQPDIERSLWDHESLLVDIDVEYENFDFPGEPFLNPTRSFGLQRPVVNAMQEVLVGFGIAPLHLVSGRGHHFVWSIRRGSPAFRQLTHLGRAPESLICLYRKSQSPKGDSVEPPLGYAFAGLSLVVEYITHCILRIAAPMSEIPIQVTAIEVGKGKNGREIISLDISEYGDPLHLRHMRVPFSAYLKPQQQRRLIGDHVADALPALFEIPLFEISDTEAIAVMRDPDAVAALARRCRSEVPDYSKAMNEVIASYLASPLARFHQWFYDQPPHPPEHWPETYDRMPLEYLPACTRQLLEQPNDLLLKPASLQHVTRVLLALGWHPRHIAGMIWSKYQQNEDWGQRWLIYDAANRADFYTRVFAGLIATGCDRLVDFNCVSHKEKGYCFHVDSGCSLDEFCLSLQARMQNEQLGHRPFNRLLLSNANS
jgi:hypothetical protein